MNTTSLYDSSRSKLGCAVSVVCLSTFFFCFVGFYFVSMDIYELYFVSFHRHSLGCASSLTERKKKIPQPIVDQSTLRPSCSYASSTKLERTFLRPLLPPRHNITRNRPPTPMDTPTSLPGPWILQCSLQPASVPARSFRIRTISCLRALPSPTTTRSCIG